MHNGNGANGSAFGYESDTSSTPSSAASSRRGSLAETKNRVFGLAETVAVESPRRRVVDRMKSNIFAEPEPAPIVRTPSVKKYEHGKLNFSRTCRRWLKEPAVPHLSHLEQAHMLFKTAPICVNGRHARK